MQIMELQSWSAFKALITAKALLIQYSEMPGNYDLFAPEAGAFLWHTTIVKDGGSDQTDFEANHKATANAPLEVKAAAGRALRMAPSPQPNGTLQRWSGAILPLNADGITTIFDLYFDHDVYLRGGDYYADNSLSDDILSLYVAVPSMGLTVLTIADRIAVPNSVNHPKSLVSAEAMLFPLGTALRVMYEATGITDIDDHDVHVSLNYFANDPRNAGYVTNMHVNKVS